MKKLIVVVIVLVVGVMVLMLHTHQNQYALNLSDGEISSVGSFDLKDVDWVSFKEDPRIAFPVIDGKIILSKIGDEKDVMYTYHPFNQSNRKDFTHNVSTFGIKDLQVFNIKVSDEKILKDYQVVIRIDRRFGGVGSLERDLIEGKVTL